jgi:hypothetical protein
MFHKSQISMRWCGGAYLVPRRIVFHVKCIPRLEDRLKIEFIYRGLLHVKDYQRHRRKDVRYSRRHP